MEYLEIKVPDMNDSISSVELDGKVYLIRFTYNDSKDYWYFGLYDEYEEPVLQGIKIVPNMMLTPFFGFSRIPTGSFICLSSYDKVGRYDFENEIASFLYLPYFE